MCPAYTKSYMFPTADKSNVELRTLVSACHGALLNRGTHYGIGFVRGTHAHGRKKKSAPNTRVRLWGANKTREVARLIVH